MPSDQIGSCLSHLVHIQFVVVEIRVQPLCRHREFPVEDAVFVSFLTVAVTWVKIRIHFLGQLNPDIVRKTLIQRIGDLFARNTCVGVKDCHISKCMHTGIRTACAHDLDLLSEKFCECIVQNTLDRDSVRLDLPATVIRSIICNYKSNSLHLITIPSRGIQSQRQGTRTIPDMRRGPSLHSEVASSVYDDRLHGNISLPSPLPDHWHGGMLR